jgi:psiF repeat
VALVGPLQEIRSILRLRFRRMWNARVCDPTTFVIVYSSSISHSGRNLMRTKSTVVVAIFFLLAIGAGAALGQNPPPAAHQAAAGATNKQAISKACSDLANAKNLHGKERKKFRAKCKRKGGHV